MFYTFHFIVMCETVMRGEVCVCVYVCVYEEVLILCKKKEQYGMIGCSRT